MELVYSYFVLDIVHRGHLLMMKNSKQIAGPNGRLIVGIVGDEAVIKQKGRAPVLSFSERLELAQSIKYVDVVVEQADYSPLRNVKMLRPTILMESESHDDLQIKESEEMMKSLGGRVITMPYFKGQSSANIKNKISSL
ncbi:adenylyltransferase/cytidyltransferase family protein [Litorivicinus sp.]|nr:adenylyltransferase/cytidyltransferase family protein [Litorivicinus sp.]